MKAKNILILGGDGNMGRRYASICLLLGHTPIQVDMKNNHIRKKAIRYCDAAIIATPTHLHKKHIFELFSERNDLAVLCEKPISTIPGEVGAIYDASLKWGWNLRMVNQYEYLIEQNPHVEHVKSLTLYDYYHSGGDSLYWDCINIIGLDKTGVITLRSESPIWKCIINGEPINRASIDLSYIMMIERWLSRPQENLNYMMSAHQKVLGLIKR